MACYFLGFVEGKRRETSEVNEMFPSLFSTQVVCVVWVFASLKFELLETCDP